MATVDVPQVEEGGAVAQLLKENAVGPHPQRGLEQFLGAGLLEALAVLGVHHVDAVPLGDDELARVLDRYDALVVRDQLDEPL